MIEALLGSEGASIAYQDKASSEDV